jgi:membrane associated rhomboid family serine protease
VIPLYDDNPRDSFPIVTFGLIVVNILVFLWQQTLGIDMYLYTMIPSWLTAHVPGRIPVEYTNGMDVYQGWKQLVPVVHPAGLTILTSMFMHGGFMHIAGNMLYLWIFGDNIESALGHVKYLLFYLAVGVLAAVVYILTGPGSQVPTLGASGAIAGVMGGYILLFPHANVKCLVPWGFFTTLMDVPAWIVLGIWILYQLVLSHYSAAGQGGVAYGAHIGGFLAGTVLIFVFGGRRQDTRRRFDYRKW